MEEKANAKINLCLNVKGKRTDGYHELDMIMMPLTLHDTIRIELGQEDSYTCNIEGLRMDAGNTVVKAVELMRETYSLQQHFHVHVEKRIPAEAGLAGGSADGAAVMRLLCKLCGLSVPLEELARLGTQIGADVPFCVMNRCSLVKGIGEIVEPFPFSCTWKVVLIKPKQGVSTGKAFQMLDLSACPHPDSAAVKDVLCSKQLGKLQEVVANSLEDSAFRLVPEIGRIKQELKDMGFPVVLMSGSGSTVFALCEEEALAQKALAHYEKREGWFAQITSFV